MWEAAESGSSEITAWWHEAPGSPKKAGGLLTTAPDVSGTSLTAPIDLS